MKQLWYFRNIFILLILVIIIVSCSAAPDDSRSSQKEDHQSVHFSKALSPSEFSTFVKDYSLTPLGFRFEWKNHQGGYRFEGNDFAKEMDHFLTIHKESLQSLLDSFQEHPSQDSSNWYQDGLIESDIENLLAWAYDGYVPIVEFYVSPPFSGKKSSLIASVEPVNSLPTISESPFEEDGQDEISTSSYSHESWAPYQGYSKVNKSIAINRLYFNNKSAFSSTSTYEHETQVYDTNFANYASYWSSDLPCAYLDTRVGDSIDNFTIGSACASSISLYYGYYTSISLYGQSASNATVRIKGQLGHRYPSYCYSTWCVYPDATTVSMYTFTAPNSGNWWTY